MWYVYIVRCADESLYTGIATDVERRVLEHNDSYKGAKYTRSRGPVDLVYKAKFNLKAEAYREEYRIKKLSRKEKLELVETLRG